MGPCRAFCRSRRFPLYEVFSLPCLSAETTVANTNIIKEMFQLFPELQKEHSDIHLLDIMGTVPYQIPYH